MTITSDQAATLQRLATLHAKRIGIELVIRRTVVEARGKGISWSWIGNVLEMTRAGVRQKYQPMITPPKMKPLHGASKLF